MRIPITALVAFAVIAISTTTAFGQSPLDYKTAFERAQKGDKPLLVLVTADWCPPCQAMKKTTIPELMKRMAFKHTHFAAVDFDRDKQIAKHLTEGRGVPQLVMYEKKQGKWTRRYIAGYKTASIVEAFMAQSKQIQSARMADAGQAIAQRK